MKEEQKIVHIYLDACCLNRPFDDQTQDRIRLESEAVLLILSRAEAGQIELVASEALDFEIMQNPDPERRMRVSLMTATARQTVSIGRAEEERALQLETLGFRAYDALHIACAESGGADVLLTTDDRMIQLAFRTISHLRVRVENPLTWLQIGGE